MCCLVKDRYGDQANDSGSESSESSSDESEVVSSMQHAPLFYLVTVAIGRNSVTPNHCHSLPGTGPFFGKGLLSNPVPAEEEGP